MCRNTKILTYFTAGKGSKIKEEQYEEKNRIRITHITAFTLRESGFNQPLQAFQSAAQAAPVQEAQEETPPLHPVQKQVTQVSQQKSRKQ